MTCANWLLTIAAVLILILQFWDVLSASATMWVTVVAAVVVLIVTWTMVECKVCKIAKKKK